MKVLVTGAAGMLGRAVVAAFQSDHTVIGVDLPEGDLTQPSEVMALFRVSRPDWVVHTAAFTDVDGAETQTARAWAVNVEATAHLCAACDQYEAGLTYLSTDYVFAGSADGYDEDSPRDPINYYGLTKARGEEAVELRTGPWQIVRTSWLFGPGPHNFVLTIRRLLDEQRKIRVVNDQVGCPTYAPDLAVVLLWLVGTGQSGYYHGTNAGSCTWFAFAREIARLGGADPTWIEPCTSHEYPTPARRPACSILRSRHLEALGCPPRPTWSRALKRYLRLLDPGTRR